MVTEILLLGATLIAVTGIVQAASARFALPQAFVVSFVGILFGGLFLAMHAALPEQALQFVEPIINWPLSADTCLTLFLPPLLFQAALSVEIRDMLADCGPILILAVLGVFVATGITGFAASHVSGVPLRDGLLLGAIIATTDASAVLAVFRSLTAPSRLVRLVEGESLLNDAAAISIASVLLTAPHVPIATASAGIAVLRVFAISFFGGALFGALAGRLLAWALVHLGGEGKAELTLTLAVPYPLYIICEHHFHLSGVVAVVTAGLVVSALGRTRLSPRNWSHLQLLWEQLAAIAGTVVFLLATIRVPALLRSAHVSDLWTLGAVVIAALLARIAVLFGIFPVMARLRLSEIVSPAYKLVIAWGGLRGAVTIVLALGVAGNATLPEPTRRFVTVLATGFVLFTLIVNGPTIKPLIRKLRLDRLSAQDEALQKQVVCIANAGVDLLIEDSARRFEIDTNLAEAVVAEYHRTVSLDAFIKGSGDQMSDEDRLAAGLLALARKESDLIPMYGSGVVGVTNLDRMVSNAAAMTEAVRRDGMPAYRAAAAQILCLPRTYQAALWMHRHLKIDLFFAHALQNRFELLMCRRAVLEQLKRYNDERLTALLGLEPTKALGTILCDRVKRTEQAINDMRKDFGQYARALEQRMLLLVALNAGRDAINSMYQDQSISKEVFDSLARDFNGAWNTAIGRPALAANET